MLKRKLRLRANICITIWQKQISAKLNTCLYEGIGSKNGSLWFNDRRKARIFEQERPRVTQRV